MDLNTSKHHTTCKFLDPTPNQNIGGGMRESAFWFLHVAVLTQFGKYHFGGDAGPVRRVCLPITATPAEQPWQARVSLRQFCRLLPHTHAGRLNGQQSLQSRAMLRRIPHTELHKAACHLQVHRDSPTFVSSITFLLFLHILESTLSSKFPSSQILSLFSFITSSQDPFISLKKYANEAHYWKDRNISYTKR